MHFDQDLSAELMAAPVPHADLLARAQAFATEADYDSVRHDRPLCDFMKTQCILCSKHVVSVRSLTAHLRSNHPGQMQEAIALGIQRTRQHTGNLSPCSFCNMEFRQSHLCPVTTQVAVLEMQVSTPDDPRHFTCFMCQFVAHDKFQLRQHLGRIHNFPCFDWIPARDSLPDQMTCAHCGSTHSGLESLRKHIIYGHCHHFANRTWTRNGDDDIVEHLRLGRIDLLLADSEVRKRLTLHCQFCNQTFTQACNLISHLFHQHSDIAQEAETFQHVLQQRYAPRGCYCMPPVRVVRQTHQCVAFLQLSMMHYNGNKLLSIPLAYDVRAHDLMDTHLPLPCLNLVHDCLQTRDFALLQQDANFRRALCDRCLCCGKKMTLTGPSQEHLLHHHLRTCHAEPRHIIDCLVQMVIYRRQHDHLQNCDWCGKKIVPVDALTEYDDHLAECPALLHFATWLALPLHPLSHGDSTGRHSNADVGGSRQHGLGLRGVKRTRPEEAEGSTTNTSIKDFFARQRLQRGQHVQDDDANGQSSAPPRAGSDGNTVPEQLRTLPVDEQGRHDCTPAPREHQLEEGPTAEHGGQTPSTTSVSLPPENSDSTSHQVKGKQIGRPSLDLKHQISTGDARWIMAVSSLEPCQQAPGVGREETQHTHGGVVDPARTDSSSIGATLTGGQVPFSPEQDQGCPSYPLEARDRCEEHQTSSTASRSDGELGMAIDLTTHQTTPFDSKQTGRRTHEIHEAEVNRLQLCCNLMALTLVNDDVQCYVNTVFITVYWTHLLCSDFVINTWGSHTVGMMQLLVDHAVAPLCIRQRPFFAAGFQQWEGLRSHGQHDYGDFLCFFLGWLNTNLVDQMFQRRYTTDAGVVIADKSSRHAPILLHSELWSEIPGVKRFQSIVDSWTQVQGMTSALVVASKIICFQFCRFQSMTLADRTSFDFGNLCIYLTAYTNDQVSTARIPYRVVALVHYSGDSWSGHYTCAISYNDSYGQQGWLHYDDNRPPNVWREIPEWFTWNISHVWLVRADRFLEWHVPPSAPAVSDVAARAQALEEVLANLA